MLASVCNWLLLELHRIAVGDSLLPGDDQHVTGLQTAVYLYPRSLIESQLDISPTGDTVFYYKNIVLLRPAEDG